jgi:hypothetical protein
VHHGWFKEIFVSYLPVGHTHLEIDANWKYFSEFLKTNNVFTWSDYLNAIKGIFCF